jgi:hypothetical protein
LVSNQGKLIIDSEATISEFNLKKNKKEDSIQYFNLSKDTWQYQLATNFL